MTRLPQQLLRIMALRGGPQDLPANWSTAALTVLAYIALGMLADRMLQLGDSSMRSLFSIGLQVLVITGLLRIRGLHERLAQTIAAVAGTGSIFGLVSILLLAQAPAGNMPAGMAMLWFGLFIWSLVVDAHIYRSALSTTMSMGVLIAVLIFALNFIIIDALYPAAQAG